MAATTSLVTVEEFHKLPEDTGPVYHELHHGEVVAVSRPKLKYIQIQKRDVKEFSFRPGPEYEPRVADVAISRDRWDDAGPEGDFPGVPDLVVEVLSLSNTASELFDKEQICLENGALQFWVVDQERRQVKVSTPDGHTIRYQSGQEFSLPFLGTAA